MKIRTDFVTNSSSSSFTMINMTNKVLVEIFDKYDGVFEYNGDTYNSDVDKIEIIGEERSYEVPERKEDILFSLICFISEEIAWMLPRGYDDDEEFSLESVHAEEENDLMALEIWERKDEVMEAMKSFYVETREQGWGDSTESSGGEDWEELKLASYNQETDEFKYDCESDVEDWNEDYD